MKNFKFLLILGVLGAFSGIGLAGELVIKREKKLVAETDEFQVQKEWKKVEGTDFFIGKFKIPGGLTTYQADDPFGDGKKGAGDRAQEILESMGIGFPEGATALVNELTSELVVRNTLPNLELIWLYLEPHCDYPPQMVAVRTEIYEVTQRQSLQLQESAQAEADHKPERDAALRAVREGDARLVGTHSLVTTAGQRAKLDGVTAMAMTVPGGCEKNGVAIEKLVDREYGTKLEVEPNVAADGFTISLNIALEHHTAEPELVTVAGKGDMPKFHAKSVSTNVVLYTCGYILLATWKPTGKAEYAEGDLMQVVFVTASLQGAP